MTYRLPVALACLGSILASAGTPESDRAAENARMAWEFHRAVAGTSGNSLISPHSISSALGILSLGARGQSLAELRQTLHEPQNKSAEDSAYGVNNQRMAEVATRDGIELVISNALLVAKDSIIREDYKSAVANIYGGGVFHTRDELREWMGRSTKGKIVVVPDQEMDPDTFVAINAVYFLGKFENPFEKELTIKNATFYTANGAKAEIPLMKRTGDYAITAGEGFRRLCLPYKGGSFSLEILLPDEGRSLAQVERAMTPEAFAKLLAQPLAKEQTEVYLPRFKFKRYYNLVNCFPKLGLGSLVSRSGADFSGICGAPGTFKLSSASHIAQVDVDEVGTEAVAVTIFGGSGGGFGGSAPRIPVFRADRPFLFVLRTNETILFIGRVENPHPAAR